MSNIGKILFSMMVVVITFTYLGFRTGIVSIDTKKDVYTSAINAATQLATQEMINTDDINKFYDADRDKLDISMNMDRDTIENFKNNLINFISIQRDGSLAGVSNINVPLCGYIGYSYIVGVTYNNIYLLPMEYTTSDESNNTWRFTLGDDVYKNGVATKLSKLTDAVPYGFSTFYDFRDFVVALTIDSYLNEYSGASFNMIAENTGVKLDFDMGLTNNVISNESYRDLSSVINGPGTFAIVDVYTGDDNGEKLFERIASFGGSELEFIDQHN